MNERLKTKRKERGLTQAQLAQMANVDRSMISKLETGSGCSMDVGLRIAKALGTTLDELFDSTETSATEETA